MKSDNSPVIIEAPPPHDLAAPRSRCLFRNGNIDRNGPAREKFQVKVETMTSLPALPVGRRTCT